MVSHPTMIAAVERTRLASPASVVPRCPVRLQPRPLEDEQLRADIELLLDVIVAAADYPNHLTPQQVDAALQLPLAWPGAS